MKKPTVNIFTENIYSKWQINEKKLIDIAKKILLFYIKTPEILEYSCLAEENFSTISFDILYCGGEKTQQINKAYRNKDYVADIITFAIFADSDERFIFDGEINLGEIILALDKIILSAEEKAVTKEEELCFLISHGIMHLLGFDHKNEKDYNFIVKYQNLALATIKDKDV